MSQLQGRLLTRANKALELSAELGDGDSLLTQENLIKCGFVPGEESPAPATAVEATEPCTPQG